MPSMSDALGRLKADLSRYAPEDLIRQSYAARGRTWRERALTPVVTTSLLLQQVLHGNTAVSHLRHLAGLRCSDAAYCRARARLPLGALHRLQEAVAGRAPGPVPRWRGHRVYLIDGSGFSMPDTDELREAFGGPTGQAEGCGFPAAHLLVLFDLRDGLLLKAVPAPLRTHDLRHAPAMHDELAEGDVLVGDRAFGSFAHLALLRRRGLHGVFRAHQRRPGGRSRRPAGRRDRKVAYAKPKRRPAWLSEAEYAALPAEVRVREVRYDVRLPGRRVRRVALVTTLLDKRRYPAAALAALYARRWEAETNLRHLKQTLGLDVLRCKTVPGVAKELTAFTIVYNLVRKLMRAAARRQKVEPARVSFVDAWRWLRRAAAGEAVPRLRVNPERPGRAEPRVRKRRPKEFPVMKRPRAQLRQALFKKQPTA
jgi:DDE family transposase